MSINTLCIAAFRKIAVGRISAAAARYSTQQSNSIGNIVSRLTPSSYGVSRGTEAINSTASIKFTPGTLNIDFGMPTHGGLRNIIDMPVARIPPLHEPMKRPPIEYDSPVPEKSIDLPPSEKIFEKLAVRMLVIRHKKMKKHKRKKLAKKMKFVWAKLKLKRDQRKEKIFQNQLIRGEILPREMIKKFRNEKRAKREAGRNKPRLTL
ncbi:uncharacterized protein LOC105284920 isoform X2 [Ooceraea biroi]|uniref:uncharacterized protein LOC105284920 isoform X2 n=1 Tax=Ooceraea biroi TaxID=2015173 RepID=UPI0005BDE213|nr:uncharacterized protein LOC105284920 isoform X2 [Ooceraea biroi]